MRMPHETLRSTSVRSGYICGARALRGRVSSLALSVCEVGAQFHHTSRFRRPPCDPGRSDFPSPVLTLAVLREPSRNGGSSSADARTPLPAPVDSRTRPCFEDIGDPALSPGPVLGPPSAQSPFACSQCYRLQGGVPRHLGGRYPSFLAHTGSCARPNPSRRLWPWP